MLQQHFNIILFVLHLVPLNNIWYQYNYIIVIISNFMEIKKFNWKYEQKAQLNLRFGNTMDQNTSHFNLHDNIHTVKYIKCMQQNVSKQIYWRRNYLKWFCNQYPANVSQEVGWHVRYFCNQAGERMLPYT